MIATASPSPAHSRDRSALRIHLPGVEGTLIVTEPVVVGRDSACDLQLDGDGISPRHAEIYRVDSLWWVRDLGCSDGTHLDDEIVDVAPLGRRSTLQLGTDGPILRLEPAPSTTSSPAGTTSSRRKKTRRTVLAGTFRRWLSALASAVAC